MIFFTRALQDGIQDDSGWTRRAERTWARNQRVYGAYLATIGPLLPRSVARLCRQGLHDAEVASVSQHGSTVTFVMDASYALGGFRGRHVQLTFSGVRGRVATRPLIRQWWLYEEAHLSSRARFALHILFTSRELEIEADDLTIEVLQKNPR